MLPDRLRRSCELRPLLKDDFRIVVRLKRLVNGVRLHVDAALRTLEEAEDCEQTGLIEGTS